MYMLHAFISFFIMDNNKCTACCPAHLAVCFNVF